MAPAAVTLTVVNHVASAGGFAATLRAIGASTVNVLAHADPGNGDTGQRLTVTAVTQGTLGRVTTDGTTVTYDPKGCAAGSDLFSYSVGDGLTSATAYVAVTIARPGQSGQSRTPVTDAPALSFISGSTMSSTVPMRLSWCGLTSTTKRLYRVVQSANAGASYPTTLLNGVTATSSTRSLTVGINYAWRVRTSDGAGRTGSYATSLTSRLTRLQDSSTSTISYHGTWHVSRSSSYSGGTERYATSTSATATYRTAASVRGIAIVAARGRYRGSMRVYVDGVLVATISQRASATQYRRVLYARGLTVGVAHTITIRPAGNGRIDLDAILALG